MAEAMTAEIVDYLNKGVSKRSVAKILGCSPTTSQHVRWRSSLVSTARRSIGTSNARQKRSRLACKIAPICLIPLKGGSR